MEAVSLAMTNIVSEILTLSQKVQVIARQAPPGGRLDAPQMLKGIMTQAVLTSIRDQLAAILTQIDNDGKVLQAAIHGVHGTTGVPCTPIVPVGTPATGSGVVKKYVTVASQPPPPPVSSRLMATQWIEVAGGLGVKAVVIAAPPANIMELAGGVVYYITNWNQFAFRIGSHLLHGNIGEITDVAHKTVECKSDACVDAAHRAKCTYYHDPETRKGSKESRKFFSDYTMPTGRTLATTPFAFRSLASASVHILLCAILTKK